MARETMDDLRARVLAAEHDRAAAIAEATKLRAVLSVIRAALNEALEER